MQGPVEAYASYSNYWCPGLRGTSGRPGGSLHCQRNTKKRKGQEIDKSYVMDETEHRNSVFSLAESKLFENGSIPVVERNLIEFETSDSLNKNKTADDNIYSSPKNESTAMYLEPTQVMGERYVDPKYATNSVLIPKGESYTSLTVFSKGVYQESDQQIANDPSCYADLTEGAEYITPQGSNYIAFKKNDNQQENCMLPNEYNDISI